VWCSTIVLRAIGLRWPWRRSGSDVGLGFRDLEGVEACMRPRRNRRRRGRGGAEDLFVDGGVALPRGRQ